jgi:uncharacterized protein YjbI with pentapeptide repeats
MKKHLESIAKFIPAIFKNATDYLKQNFDENGQKIFESAGGTAGIVIGFLAQPLIDSYYKSLQDTKLDNFGFSCYLEASLLQAKDSLSKINGKIDKSLSPNLVFKILSETIKQEAEKFNPQDILLVYRPKYHPASVFVKDNFQTVLRELGTSPTDVKDFIKDFNIKIDDRVIKVFGDDYNIHLKNIEAFTLIETEAKFLFETVKQGKIGFKESENLKYEETYAEWKKVSELRTNNDERFDPESYEEDVKDLCPIEQLIEEYFNYHNDNTLDSILFVIADFGKGKSIFMRHYAAEMAKAYISISEGYFPIYFNLRDYKNYSTDHRLGIISDYMQTKHGIKIDDEHFKKKKYLFLIDSLDESGDLNSQNINNVITSVKKIQGIDKNIYKNNRIVITSRPFDEGLTHQLDQHSPYTKLNDEGREISYYINVYGFTKMQFNHWLIHTLKEHINLAENKVTGFAKEIVDSLKHSDEHALDLYDKLLNRGTLSESELRRPIFAYMIYQLIVNNVDFLSIGKLGIYLSFLNLLTKEAKHIHDLTYKVDLREEFEFRNVLQATASLWMHERQRGKQGTLIKADICRVLEGRDNNESDKEILDRLKGTGLTEIQFLSHSYFGENDNVLHFQHQSFAEILLAEYYVKVFIKYALDEESDVEEARVKLVLGEPTEQTIHFMREMLALLKDTVKQEATPEIIEKRRLLFPLMASLSTKKHNKLFCNDLYYSWFNKCKIQENQTEYPPASLQNWCFDDVKIEKIIELSAKIIQSKNTLLPTRSVAKTALFNNEVIEIQNQDLSSLPPNIDKWLAMLVGNSLHNHIGSKTKLKLFNKDYQIPHKILFELVKGWNYAFEESAPRWGRSFFIGMDMSKNDSILNLSCYNFDGLNFSYSHFKHLTSWGANWSRCKLDNCKFEKFSLVTCLLFGASFNSIINFEDCDISNCEVTHSTIKLLDVFPQSINGGYDVKGRLKHRPMIYLTDLQKDGIVDLFTTLSGFIVHGLKKSFFKIEEIEKLFDFEGEETKATFLKRLKPFRKYQTIK